MQERLSEIRKRLKAAKARCVEIGNAIKRGIDSEADRIEFLRLSAELDQISAKVRKLKEEAQLEVLGFTTTDDDD
jgi:hypothetical protein